MSRLTKKGTIAPRFRGSIEVGSMENVVIIGSGPAGFTAAIYTGRAQLNPLVIAGPAMGGQVALSSEIGNYPGFPEDVNGAELAQLM